MEKRMIRFTSCFVILFALGVGRAHAQLKPELNSQGPIKTFKSLIDFEVDNLGNIYGVSEDGQVKKWSPKFDSVGLFNDIRQNGPLSAMDVSNPLRILLFYKDFGTLIILDRFLNQRTTLDLRSAGILQAGCIAQSFDNQLWVYDEWDNRIKKLDETGKPLVESPDFRILYDQPPKPQVLLDAHQLLYAYDTLRGLLTMDYYGAPRNLHAFIGWKNLQTANKGLVATNSSGLVYWEPGKMDLQYQNLDEALLQARKIRLSGGRLFTLYANGELSIYPITPL